MMKTYAIYNQTERSGGSPFGLCPKHRAEFSNGTDSPCILIELPQESEKCKECPLQKGEADGNHK